MSGCTCDACVARCVAFPGWMRPLEAEMALNAGLAQRLMLDWFEPDDDYGNNDRIDVLCPAAVGRGGHFAPEMSLLGMLSNELPPSRCTFLIGNRCDIHSSGFKPSQCRTVFACRPGYGEQKIDIIPAWDTSYGRRIVMRWRKLVNNYETV